MKKPAFQRCLKSVPTLTSAQRGEIKIAIEQVDNKNLVGGVASLVGTPTCCPHCHHPHIRPWGRASGLKRYRCKGCQRTFSPLTNTPLAGLHHKDRWLLYLEGFQWGESVRKAARRCGINQKASFNWRHRFLALPSDLQARQESGISRPTRLGSCAPTRGNDTISPGNPDTGAVTLPNEGFPVNRFRSWWFGTALDPHPMRSFPRTTTLRSKLS